jgi:hypothetical protein
MRSDINGMGFFDLETSQKRSFQMLPLHPAPMPEGSKPEMPGKKSKNFR